MWLVFIEEGGLSLCRKDRIKGLVERKRKKESVCMVEKMQKTTERGEKSEIRQKERKEQREGWREGKTKGSSERRKKERLERKR